MLNETGMLKDRMFQPDVGLELAKKELGPKSVWLPVVDDALKTCNEYGKGQFFLMPINSCAQLTTTFISHHSSFELKSLSFRLILI